MRRVEAAGAATKVTVVTPFRAPSDEPSVNVVPVLSEYEVTNPGLVVAGVPLITA